MKHKKTKTKRNIKRAERHGYSTEGKMRKEIAEAKIVEKEVENIKKEL